jgi:hypothetical protein
MLWLGGRDVLPPILGGLERRVEDGLTYEKANDWLRSWWEETNERIGPAEAEPFEAWISTQLWEEVKRELAEQEAMEEAASHADLEYRILRGKDPDEGILSRKTTRTYHAFYDSYDEESSK